VQFTMLLTLGSVIHGDFRLPAERLGDRHSRALRLPFSIIGTFAVMYMLDYSLDKPVDDGRSSSRSASSWTTRSVMLENIYRHVEMGEDPLTASLVGSARDRLHDFVSMTLSLAAVFIPVLFMGGVLGRLFREFSVTICVRILIFGRRLRHAYPMLCSLFSRNPQARRGVKFGQVTERGFDNMLKFYDRTLQVVLSIVPSR